MRKSIWNDGPGYLERAFRWAHNADPKALLFYNDYDSETMNAKADAIYRMARDFKSRGVPLDGIGLQMHIGLKPLALDQMASNMRRLIDLGLQVHITELDVALPLDDGIASGKSLAEQANRYRDVVALCVNLKGCTAVQTWGFTDKYSWIPGFKKGFGAALEFDSQYQPKPAYHAMIDGLKR
jgi:endo-1,4-beta-xylanase